jgi:hypothetical protein
VGVAGLLGVSLGSVPVGFSLRKFAIQRVSSIGGNGSNAGRSFGIAAPAAYCGTVSKMPVMSILSFIITRFLSRQLLGFRRDNRS